MYIPYFLPWFPLGGVEKMNGGRDLFHAPRWPAKWWYLAMNCWCECVILIIKVSMLQCVKCEESQDACLKVKTHLIIWWLLMRGIVIFTSFVLTDVYSSLIQDRFLPVLCLQNSSSPVSGVTGRPRGFPLAPEVPRLKIVCTSPVPRVLWMIQRFSMFLHGSTISKPQSL